MTNQKWAVGLAVLALATSLTGCKDQHKRCVDEKTHKVVASKNCDTNSSGSTPPGGFIWYFGGRGTRVGETARGGSTRSSGGGSKSGRRGNGGGKSGGGKTGGGGGRR
jgi:hypothetical protein